MIHNFNERLAWSEQASTEPFWDAVYRKAFPNLVNHMQCLGDTQSQRQGIDRIIHLSNGKTLYIDEKKREKDYGDILLEYVSVDTTGAPGWMEKDLSIDFLAYAIMPRQRVYLFPWTILRRVWLLYGDGWKTKYGTKRSPNRGYWTLNVPVPTQVLFKTIWSMSMIDVSGELNGGQWN